MSENSHGRDPSGPGSCPTGDAPDGSSSQATAIPSRGRLINGVEDLPSEHALIMHGSAALSDSIRYDIEREARNIVNLWAPGSPPALLQSIEVALFRAERRRIADLKRERVNAGNTNAMPYTLQTSEGGTFLDAEAGQLFICADINTVRRVLGAIGTPLTQEANHG